MKYVGPGCVDTFIFVLGMKYTSFCKRDEVDKVVDVGIKGFQTFPTVKYIIFNNKEYKNTRISSLAVHFSTAHSLRHAFSIPMAS